MRYVKYKILQSVNLWIKIHVMVGSLIVFAACGPVDTPVMPVSPTNGVSTPASDVQSDQTQESQASGYPAPVTSNNSSNSGYPAPATPSVQNLEGYPAPPITDDPLSPRFQFDLPLTTEMTTVTGKAPPNLSLILVDITYAGIVLGSARSDGQGSFAIGVNSLIEGHRIGLTISEAESGKTVDQKAAELFPYRGDQFMNVPNVGVFFETALVQP